MRLASLLGLSLFTLVISVATLSCYAQDRYLGRYDLYTGFSGLNTPGLSHINPIGFHLQTGYTPSRWVFLRLR